MKVLLLLLALARAAPDDAPEPGTDLSAPDDAPSFEDDLEGAKRLYFEGEHERSLELLAALRDRLDAGESIPTPVIADALIYLGEVQFQLGDRTASWETFEDLLRRAPGASISPLEHPADVVRWFELVRDKVEQEPVPVPVPTGPPPPLPAWGYAPFGAPQIAMGRTARGITYLTLQSGFAIVSIWSYVHLARINREDHPPDWSDDEIARRVNLERWAVQWPATLGFYATWAVSVFDARRAWRVDHAPPVAVGLVPGPRGALLVVRGRL